MRIYTNTYSIPKFGTTRNNSASDNKSNNISFGLNISRGTHISKQKASYLKHIISKYGAYLGLDSNTAKNLLSGLPEKNLEFFKCIADRYNCQNFYAIKKEDPGIPLRIFNTIKKPHSEHFYILRHTTGDFNTVEKLLKHANNKKHMEFIYDFHKRNYTFKNKDEVLLDILEAKNNEHIISDIEKFKTYMILNSDNPELIKELDKLISTGKFSQAENDIKYVLSLIKLHGKDEQNVLSPNLLEKHYTPQGIKLLKKLNFDFTFFTPNQSHQEEFLRIYSTTNKDNYKFRKDFINVFKHSTDDMDKKTLSDTEITALRELLEKADKDNHTKKFLESAMTQKIGTESLAEINDILKVVPSDKAEIFFDNISRIVSTLRGKTRYEALVYHLDEPFYTDKIIAQRYKREGHVPFYKESIINKTKRYIENKINKLRYNSPKTETLPPQVPPTMQDKIDIPISRSTIISRKTTAIEKDHTLVPIPKTQSTLEKILTGINQNIKEAEKLENERKLEIKRTLKEAREAKKLKLISDINDIISKKLGKKTYDDQVIDYNKKATKIRLSLLPEIFNSIKATRKTNRALGQKESISSKDALELYKRINGHNRKIVRYMLLKESNETATRMFSVKDIINFIDSSEKIIAKNKSIDKNFKPKEFYDTMFELYSGAFGKVQTQKRVSKKIT